MIRISVEVETSFDTGRLPGRAVQHTVSIDTYLALRTFIIAIPAVTAICQSIRAVGTAEPPV
jgi:hypothetical protein